MKNKARGPVFVGASLAYTALWTGANSVSDWGAYWLAWMTFGFLIPELYGLYYNTADTLSRNVWGWEHLNFGHPFDFATWTAAHWTLAILVWLLFLWLSIHLPFGLLK